MAFIPKRFAHSAGPADMLRSWIVTQTMTPESRVSLGAMFHLSFPDRQHAYIIFMRNRSKTDRTKVDNLTNIGPNFNQNSLPSGYLLTET